MNYSKKIIIINNWQFSWKILLAWMTTKFITYLYLSDNTVLYFDAVEIGNTFKWQKRSITPWSGEPREPRGEIYLDRFSDFCTQWWRFTMCNRGEVYGIYGGREISLRPGRIEMENFPNCSCELKGCLNRCVQY